MPDEKMKVSARIPKNIYDSCLQKYPNMTEAINAGLELLCSTSVDNSSHTADNRRHAEDTPQTSVDNGSRQTILKLEEHILTLKTELEKAHNETAAVQNLYDNYMRQMQTLIQQKAIEVPGHKKPWYKFW